MILLGILLFNMTFGPAVATDDENEEQDEEKGENPDEPKDDDDKDGIKDDIEEKNKREIEIWLWKNVIEMASIHHSEDRKDIMDLRIQYDEGGIKIKVSFRALVKANCTNEVKTEDEEECKPEEDEKGEKETECEDHCEEWKLESELMFEVRFMALIEYIDLNDNGVFDYELDECIEDYGISS